MQKDHLLSVPSFDWKEVITNLGGSSYRADQLKKWIYNQGELDFNKMLNVPKILLDKLEEKYFTESLEVEKLELSKDGTCKWLLKTSDDSFMECVLIPEGSRQTVCLSSQVGCGMGCKFCSTAKMGFKRNLTLGEILEQFLIIQNYLESKGLGKISNIVFMGMGEPLMNANTVAMACDLFSDQKLFGLAKKRITVSTSGIPNEIVKWAQNNGKFKLAISLNGVNNEMRSSLMPINKSNSIEKLMESVDQYIEITRERVTFEYILIKNVTCTNEAAHGLKKLLSQKKCKVNLIPLNIGGSDDLLPPTMAEMNEFLKILSTGNIPVMLRKPRGSDIAAACGQLVQLVKKAA